jgi:sugar phosphate isomerase/epimerase
MFHKSRRAFLLQSALCAAGLLAGSSFLNKKKKPLLSFSTLGCPDWTFKQIIDFAAKQGYAGLELRGIQRQLNITQCNEFNSPQSRADSLRMIQDHQLRFVSLGSSAILHFPEGADRQKNLDEGKRFIDLANDIQCPFIRVFPNNFIQPQDKQTTIHLIADGLITLAEYAKGSGVSVLMETHGDLVKTGDIEMVMQGASHPHTGLVWDITNMWAITKEPPAEAYKKLKPYIRHTHIKDARIAEGKIQYTFLGKGEVPLAEAMKALITGGYKGFYSFEWEKLWHPELEEPETALAHYPTAMKTYFK